MLCACVDVCTGWTTYSPRKPFEVELKETN